MAGLVLGVAAALSMAGSVQAAAPTGSFLGNAYGTDSSITVGPISVGLGKTALIGCSCVGTDGEVLTNRVDGLFVGTGGSVLQALTISDSVYTNETATAAIVQNTSRIDRLNALGGLITADTILAVANTTAEGTSLTSTDEGTAFVNLKIAGTAIPADVAPNTHVTLPGVGEAILRKETTYGTGTRMRAITVEMISINVTTANGLGLPVGATITVAHAMSGFKPADASIGLSGLAWVATANVGAGNDLVNKIGRAGFISVPCQGTNGATLTKSAAALGVGSVLSIGSGTTTAFGSGGVSKTTSTLQSVSLLGGLVHASSVTAVAQTALAGGVRTRSADGSGFVGLTVAGLPLPVNVPPNTKVALPGIGYVILNQQFLPRASSPAKTITIGIHVFVTTTNLLGVPVGAQLMVGYASAGATMPQVGS